MSSRKFCVDLPALDIDDVGKGDIKRPLKQPVSTVTLHFPQIRFQYEI